MAPDVTSPYLDVSIDGRSGFLPAAAVRLPGDFRLMLFQDLRLVAWQGKSLPSSNF
jgi:hypothetical protein